MNNDLSLNVVYQHSKIKAINDENLLSSSVTKFESNAELSDKSKSVFSNNFIKKEIITNLLFAIGISLALTAIVTLWEPSAKISVMIATVIIISGSMAILGSLLSIFSIGKTLEVNFKDSVAVDITTTSIIGKRSEIVVLENVEEIYYITSNENTYFVISENQQNLVEKNSIILRFNNDNTLEINKGKLSVLFNKSLQQKAIEELASVKK